MSYKVDDVLRCTNDAHYSYLYERLLYIVTGTKPGAVSVKIHPDSADEALSLPPAKVYYPVGGFEFVERGERCPTVAHDRHSAEAACQELLDVHRDTAAERKATPVFSGVLMYFPDALRAIAQCSKKGNDQHNPGEPLHWARGKSDDHHDALTRHLMDAGTIDTDGIRHSAKVAWRALAALQVEIEKAEGDKDEE